MRFLMLVVIAVATGALAMTAMRTLVPQNASMFEAVRALGGDPANFKLPEIHPVKAYHDVIKQITSPKNTGVPSFGTTHFPSFQVTTPLFKPYEFKPDPGLQRAIASGIGARIQQDIRRTQDIMAYGRNPSAWHGVPPH
jgi:hypothetical protein